MSDAAVRDGARRLRLPAAAAACALLVAGMAGCQQLAGFWAVASGGDEVPAEFTLAKGPIALLIDDPDSLGVAPEAMRAMHERVEQEFTQREVNKRLISFDEVQRLATAERNYDDLSIRQIGEKLGAEQVIYVRVQYWATRANPGDPQFEGRWRSAIKVLGTQRDADVRLWPKDAPAKTLEVRTDPDLTDAAGAEIEVAQELGRKMGRVVALSFVAHKPVDERGPGKQ